MRLVLYLFTFFLLVVSLVSSFYPRAVMPKRRNSLPPPTSLDRPKRNVPRVLLTPDSDSLRSFTLPNARGSRKKVKSKREAPKIPRDHASSSSSSSSLVPQEAVNAVKRRVDSAMEEEGSDLEDIVEITGEAIDLCQGNTKVAAAVADALLSDRRVSKESNTARRRVARKTAQNKKETRERSIRRNIMNEQYEFQKGRAWITCFCSPSLSSAEFERLRMRLSHETTSAAVIRAQSRTSKIRFGVWHKSENLAQRTLVATRTIEALNDVSPGFGTQCVADEFNSYNGILAGGWNNCGIIDGHDTILCGLPLAEKVKPEMRGQFLKEVLEKDGRIPESFFVPSRMIGRRALITGAAICPTLTPLSIRQHEFIERHPKNFVLVEDQTFSAPPNECSTKANPTTGIYRGEDVMYTPVKTRLLEIIRRRYHAGEMKLLVWRDVQTWNFQHIFEVLSDAGFPLLDLAMLIPLSLHALQKYCYRSMNTIMVGEYGDNAALKETWPTSAYYICMIYLSWQWDTGLTEEKRKEICREILKPNVDMFGRATSTSEDTSKMISLISSEFWNQPEEGYAVSLPETPITMAEIAALQQIEDTAVQSLHENVPRVWFQIRGNISDIEHAQAAGGITQSGSGTYNSPHVYGPQGQLRDPATCLLLNFRTFRRNAELFGNGPAGDHSRVYSSKGPGAGGLSASEWRDEYASRIGGQVPSLDAVKSAVGEVLQGVTMISGYYPPPVSSGVPNDSNSLPSVFGAVTAPWPMDDGFVVVPSDIATHPVWYHGPRAGEGDITAFPDSMHNVAGLQHHVFDVLKLQLSPSDRNKIDSALRTKAIMKPKMRCRDYGLLTVFLCSPSSELGGVELPESQRALLASLASLRRQLYTPVYSRRSRGQVLAVFCTVIEVIYSLEESFPRSGSFARSGPSSNALYGLYLSGIIFLGIATRLFLTMMGNCEHGEFLFKIVKRNVNTRSNNIWDPTVRNLRRCLLAYHVDSATNKTASESKNEEGKIKLLYEQLLLGPQTLGSRGGEVHHFTAKMVRSRFFVLMWMKWLPDYVVGGGWWQDDDSMFTDHVRGTSVYCDYSVTDKASLFDIAWSTEADLERLLYVDTERIFASPGIYSIPGWESVNHAIDFLRCEAQSSGDGVFGRKAVPFVRDLDAKVIRFLIRKLAFKSTLSAATWRIITSFLP